MNFLKKLFTTKKYRWRLAFLGTTALALFMELLASFDNDPETDPWTSMIVQYIPAEVATAAIGALALWLPVHFGVRYYRKHKGDGDGS